MIRGRLQMVVSLLLTCGLAACGNGGTGSLPGTVSTLTTPTSSTSTSALQATSRQSAATTVATATAAYTAIDAGGPASGNWLADRDFGGGQIATTAAAIKTSGVSSPAPQAIYQSVRYGTDLTYTIANLTSNGSYDVRLHFAEIYFKAAKQRIFAIKINGVQVLNSFDIFTAAGGENIAIAEQFASTADAAGKITIELVASSNYGAIAGIEVTASTPRTTLDINTGGAAVGSWLADVDTIGAAGATLTTTAAVSTSLVSNPAPQAVYQSQRYGTPLSYAIPHLTPNGAYTVRLDFAEQFFTAAGQRVFGATINGAQVLTNFDIYHTAGGANIAVVKQFTTTADSTGTITIAFTATVNNASIAGIEITGGSGTSVPSPTPAPITSPTATPTTPPNGTSYPNAGWLSYSHGPIVTSVATMYGATPTMASNSSAVINNLWGPNNTDLGLLQQVLGGPAYWDSAEVGFDYGGSQGGIGQRVTEPFFVSKASDPVYAISCSRSPYGTKPCNSGTIHIPVGALPATDSDHHMSIRDTATGLDWQFWQVDHTSIDVYSGGTIQAYTARSERYASASSEGIGMGGTASNLNVGEWAVRAEDVLAGRIPHALMAEVTCDTTTNGTTGSFVYPVIPDPLSGTQTDNGFFCGGGYSGQYPNQSSGSNSNLTYGAHLWLDVPNSQLPPVSGSCSIIDRAYLRALNEFGAYVSDVGAFNNPIMILAASDLDDTYNGGASKWAQVWSQVPNYNYGENSSFQYSPTSCGINLVDHLHVLTPPTPN